MKATLPLLFLFLSLGTAFPGPSGTNAAPLSFTASIGGFLGPTYSVELRHGTLVYSAMDGPKKAEPRVVTPSARQWSQFRRSLDEINVWQWRTNYPNPGVADGTQWSIAIEYPDRSLKARGSNNFPAREGKPSESPAMTKTFRTYTAAVKSLLGGREFQ